MESRNKRRYLEREPRPFRGLTAPLFERLTSVGDPLSEATKPFRSLNVGEAKESVRRELKRLLNTRALPEFIVAGNPLTTREYGLPDFAHVSAGDMRARDDLAALMTRAIEAFEPRLTQVRVVLEPDPAGTRSLTGSIMASMVVGLLAEPVSFPLEVHTRSWMADLKDGEPFVQVS